MPVRITVKGENVRGISIRLPISVGNCWMRSGRAAFALGLNVLDEGESYG
jgi:hypothetical protein